MVVGHGRVTPNGSLPVFSTKTAACAEALIIASCGTNLTGQHIARELAVEQTLENLEAFSTRLDGIHAMLVERGACKCGG